MFLAASLIIVPNETTYVGEPAVMHSHRSTSTWHSIEKEATADTSNNTVNLPTLMDHSIYRQFWNRSN